MSLMGQREGEVETPTKKQKKNKNHPWSFSEEEVGAQLSRGKEGKGSADFRKGERDKAERD